MRSRAPSEPAVVRRSHGCSAYPSPQPRYLSLRASAAPPIHRESGCPGEDRMPARKNFLRWPGLRTRLRSRRRCAMHSRFAGPLPSPCGPAAPPFRAPLTPGKRLRHPPERPEHPRWRVTRGTLCSRPCTLLLASKPRLGAAAHTLRVLPLSAAPSRKLRTPSPLALPATADSARDRVTRPDSPGRLPRATH